MTLLTEEQAREKWCLNYPPLGNAGFKCVGSDCMAWRWGIREVKEFPEGFEKVTGPSFVWVKYEHTERGYCGLAGKVQP